jgi:DNA-binding transcriptional MocR family regulator
MANAIRPGDSRDMGGVAILRQPQFPLPENRLSPMTADKEPFRYRKLAEDLENQIRDGAYAPGERLPSLRRLHRKLNLSVNTVHQAFQELEDRGLIESRPKSGFFVAPVSLQSLELPDVPSPAAEPRPVEIGAMVNAVLRTIHDPDMLSLSSSATHTALLPARRFARMLKEISAKELESLIGYAPAEGLPELRRQIARRHLGLLPGAAPEDVVITCGCMEAVTLCLQAAAKPGDTVAIEAPTHFGFLQYFRQMGLLAAEVPTHPRDGVDIGALERLLHQTKVAACLFMPNFQNPTGALMPDDRKERLVRLLNDREIPLIEDDICAEMGHGEGPRPSMLQAFDRRGLVMTCSSFSKTLAPGFRVGWVLPGRRFRDRILRLKAGTTVCTAAPDQALIARFLAEPACERHFRSLRSALGRQVTRTALAVQRHFPEGTRLAVPMGGSLLWIQLPGGAGGLELYRRALRAKIAILPGSACTVSGGFSDFIRLGCGAPFTEETEAGIRTLGEITAEISGASG